MTHDEEEKLRTLDTLGSENPMQLIHTMVYLCGGGGTFCCQVKRGASDT